VVRLHDWLDRSVNPEGEVIEVLGKANEPQAELKAIFRKHNLPTSFPVEVESEVASLPDEVRPEDRHHRLDLRSVPTFTIDPDDAKDFDDALSIEPLADGDLRVGVHIADVGAYVKPDTGLDREAQRRGNSTYLVGTVVPMLPFKLSNGLCSLKEDSDRLTKSVFLTFSSGGKLKATDFANSVIRSRKRLTYKQAFALLKEDDLNKVRQLPLPAAHQTGSTGRSLRELPRPELQNLQKWIRQLWSIATRLRHERMQGGSLDLDMPEVKIFVDEQGYADRLERIVNDESHQLIEEFMLAANEAVALALRRANLPAIYRVHGKPDEEKLGDLRQFLLTFNLQVGDLTKRGELVKLLRKLRDHPQGHLLRVQVLRSLRKAVYLPSPEGHYGLNKSDYLHFTSPIRRYADLVVHRSFEQYLAKFHGRKTRGGSPGISAGRAQSLSEHLSLTEQNSAEAERESIKVKLLEFFERELERKKKTKFEAVVTEIRNHGLFIELTESMAFGFVRLSSLRDDFYVLSPDGSSIVGRRSKRKITLGQKIPVMVEKVDRVRRQIDFLLA
jgi:ribonuclease R